MIHEVMVLDHGGPALRPDPLRRGGEAVRVRGASWSASCVPLGGADRRGRLGRLRRRHARCSRSLIGVVESTMARLRLAQVPSPAGRRVPAVGLRRRPAREVNRCIALVDPLLVLVLLLELLRARHEPAARRHRRRRRCRACCSACSPSLVHGSCGVARRCSSPSARSRSRASSSRGCSARAMREAAIRREVEPLIGFIPSLLARRARHRRWRWSSRGRCRWRREHAGSLLVPASLATVLDRLPHPDHAAQGDHPGASATWCWRTASSSSASRCSRRCRSWSRSACCSTCSSAIFVMGIIINHISREFASLDTARLRDAEGVSDDARCSSSFPLVFGARRASPLPSDRVAAVARAARRVAHATRCSRSSRSAPAERRGARRLARARSARAGSCSGSCQRALLRSARSTRRPTCALRRERTEPRLLRRAARLPRR